MLGFKYHDIPGFGYTCTIRQHHYILRNLRLTTHTLTSNLDQKGV